MSPCVFPLFTLGAVITCILTVVIVILIAKRKMPQGGLFIVKFLIVYNIYFSDQSESYQCGV